MLNKVVFVEDEIVTREGIRDHVDWQGNGFQLCGEAPDGEMALQVLRTARPDLLITDIKMPFMDGLELCRIVREEMPWVKIVILSGHDEFEYAQEAIKLGVAEYLLKPVTAQDLHRVLQKVGALLEAERSAQQNARRLSVQLQENQAALRERFLSQLVVGSVAPSEAIEKSRQYGLDLLANYYQVVIVRAPLPDRSQQLDYEQYQRALQTVSELAEKAPGVFSIRMDWEKVVLLVRGDTPDDLVGAHDLLLAHIREATNATGCALASGSGFAKNRITYIHESFREALADLKQAGDGSQAPQSVPAPGERRVSSQHAALIQRAKEYIEQRYVDSDLLLSEVAARVNLSPSHFSVIFSRETGQTFKDYLTEIRIKKAKDLLRTTALQSAEISYRVGYGDPHYFSFAFHKHTGLTPTEFRAQVQPG